MKLLLLALSISFIITSCTPTKETLVGEWKLIEILMDPGDGSGTFQKAESEWTMIFKDDGTVSSSSGLCLDNTAHSGIYTEKEIKGETCQALYTYEFQGAVLVLSNKACIEPCRYKFSRVEE